MMVTQWLVNGKLMDYWIHVYSQCFMCTETAILWIPRDNAVRYARPGRAHVDLLRNVVVGGDDPNHISGF